VYDTLVWTSISKLEVETVSISHNIGTLRSTYCHFWRTRPRACENSRCPHRRWLELAGRGVWWKRAYRSRQWWAMMLQSSDKHREEHQKHLLPWTQSG
jgi:hypothetical protein